VRRLCPQCVEKAAFDHNSLVKQLELLGLPPSAADGVTHLPMANGCPSCRGLGFRGRVGVFEILRVEDKLHDLIVQRESARAIRKAAVDAGMDPLETAGWNQVRAGLTALDEVIRVLSMAEAK
jgi:type II secretory ATPase GspE/PulE/Tfp pilus assembly ATPase PilB-like protein